jgi:oxygen-dependent protoporphyrinogen oxidase
MTRPPADAPRVAVVGGGIAGLSAAWHLLEAGCTPVVLEGTAHVGGLVRTLEVEGRRLELGADTLVTQKAAAVALCRRVGLGGDLVFHEARATATRVLFHGRPVPIPEGMNLLAPSRWAPLLRSPLLSWRGVARLALEPRVAAVTDPGHDESLASFIRRRFGREVLDAFAEPVLTSLFLGDAERLSLRLTMPRLLEAERLHGSVRRALARAQAPDGEARTGRPHAGSGGFATLRDGLGALPQRLASLLPAGSIRLETKATRIERAGDPAGFAIRLENAGEPVVADAVVLACPASQAAVLARGLDAALAGEIQALETSSCATVHLVYRRQDLSDPLEGHGFFVPRTAKLPLLACSYVSEKYPERVRAGDVVLRAFVGGARDPGALDLDDAPLAERTHAALAPILGLRGGPRLTHVQRHLKAMPHPRVGDADRLQAIRARAAEKGALAVAGGLRGAIGVPDVIASGKAAAEEVLAALRQRASGTSTSSALAVAE